MIVDNRSLWSVLKTRTVTVSVTPRANLRYMIFQVRQMADLGRSGQIAVLNGVAAQGLEEKIPVKTALSLPAKLGAMRLMYTNPLSPLVGDVYNTLAMLEGYDEIEKIVPDVLAPGDYIVLRKTKDGALQFSDALRIMTGHKIMQSKTERIAHAL